MKLTLIVAFDRNNAIGRDNDLPWKLPDDLKRFRSLTLGKPILMGRKTAQSLGRALPGRVNLVLTRSGQVPFEGMHAVASVEQAIERAAQDGAQELCVIGGGEVYRLTMQRADLLAVTEVDTVVDGADTHFPPIDPALWEAVQRESHAADARHAFAFDYVDYRRR
ncbi:diacylglycerol kinase [Xanthomonas citri pv. fuscans]|uniref:Dihydrofolate reductase n=1 Tax=Xanthomonas citri pv. fuscans TaxID=366649 RepID=A0AB34Q3M4_XANCI|nr:MULTISPECIES: dihydrofolate reductase [Xanthomonas]ATB57431.1 putative dihydrofolate reductase [Xanthomonas citri pv. fuscans]ATS64714.1 dihydrofolate reductase [Xanthomonas citri pv. phaseoli var. fuscans]ATS66483.1 dihydrofolate reductase [Xanthomonas citri pv. phaseoli var. fuscans]ATS70224.1 dihydrofolate reductase [Xanthomonas citri pv. phaseoli var. fuscans]ATS76809.1 dihydrofolate reductase [Xanthomonas citri pv. phaseoli var. fuscans]